MKLGVQIGILAGATALASIGIYFAYKYSVASLEFNPDNQTPIVSLRRNWFL